VEIDVGTVDAEPRLLLAPVEITYSVADNMLVNCVPLTCPNTDIFRL